jgi:hypothetical protein
MGATDVNQPSNGLEAPAKLWEHPDPRSTAMYELLQRANQKYGKQFESYEDLYGWSIAHISDFWGEVWQFTGIVGTDYENVFSRFTLINVDYPRLSTNLPRCSPVPAFSRGHG